MLVQLVLVVIFIVFEEIIWEGFAKPVYVFIHELHVLQRLQTKLQSVNRYLILILFMILLIGVEAAGLTAGVMAVKGMVVSAVLLYAVKIPIAAFTFWLFRATEKKLLSFKWFKYLYEKTVALFAWIKTREIYQSTVEMMKELKGNIKSFVKNFKQNYLSGENTVSKRFKRLYRFVKRMIRREDKTSS
jgi:hypothetical protein